MQKTIGRPPRYATPEDMQKRIDAYFRKCDRRKKVIGKRKDKRGRTIDDKVPNPEPYTVLGLCQYLGLTRQAFWKYEHKEPFVDTVKRAKEKCALDLTLRSIEHQGQTAGCIFQLKTNHGHKETQVNEIYTPKDESLKVDADVTIKEQVKEALDEFEEEY